MGRERIESALLSVESERGTPRSRAPGGGCAQYPRPTGRGLARSGRPRHVSTSYVERSNLTLRMQQRRFTRLTNGFSKKLRNHRAAVALYVAHYNLCRVHETIRVTPAMALGVSDHIWSIGELIEAATGNYEPPRRFGRFEVIDGGLT